MEVPKGFFYLEIRMAKVRITLTEEQAKEVMVALYKVGNPLGDHFAKLVEALDASNQAKMEATVDAKDQKANADMLTQRFKDSLEAAERKRQRDLEEFKAIFGNVFR